MRFGLFREMYAVAEKLRNVMSLTARDALKLVHLAQW
jgi:hypothetical protein